MEVLAYVVAAEEDEAEAVGLAAQPMVEWSGMQVSGLDTAKVAMLHCLLTGDEYDYAIAGYEPVFVGGDEGPVVVLVSTAAMERLAELDEEALEQLAEELSATEDFELDGWDAGQTLDLLLDMAELAQLAESQGQVLFVWMCPLTA